MGDRSDHAVSGVGEGDCIAVNTVLSLYGDIACYVIERLVPTGEGIALALGIVGSDSAVAVIYGLLIKLCIIVVNEGYGVGDAIECGTNCNIVCGHIEGVLSAQNIVCNIYAVNNELVKLVAFVGGYGNCNRFVDGGITLVCGHAAVRSGVHGYVKVRRNVVGNIDGVGACIICEYNLNGDIAS